MYICKFCNKQFSTDYKVSKKHTMTFCSRSCKTKDQRGGFQTKEALTEAIITLINTNGRYLTLQEIIKGLNISTKTLNKFKISVLLLNKLCGMKKPSSVFEYKVMQALEELFGEVQS